MIVTLTRIVAIPFFIVIIHFAKPPSNSWSTPQYNRFLPEEKRIGW